MSPRDLPLWARGAAAALLLFASWWLVGTAAIRDAVGNSVGLLSLGIVAAFILRGMHLPLDLWPPGPWRREFLTAIVVGVAALFGVSLALPRPGGVAELVVLLDRGVVVMVTAGAVAWGFGWAFVRQRAYLGWYVVGAVAAVVPFVVGVLALRMSERVLPFEVVPWDVVARVVVFAAAAGAAATLVTEELAFRRLLIGEPGRAGLVLVVVASAVAAVWHLVMRTALNPGDGGVWLGVAVGAFIVGAVYVLSQSLLVSALCNAFTFAGMYALTLIDPVMPGTSGAGDGLTGGMSGIVLAAVVAEAAVAAVLLGLVAKRNGVLGGLVAARRGDAAGG